MKKIFSLLIIILIISTLIFFPNNNSTKIKCVPIITNYMTNNDCFNTNNNIEVKGIMVHSTSVPGIMANDWYNLWNKSYKYGETDREVCVHAFVDDKAIYQYLPWEHRGWHAGGSANNNYIGFEICEPNGIVYSNDHCSIIKYDFMQQQEYFDKVWNNSVYLCTFLCKQFNLTENNIICHSEGYTLGIASNHPDITHWWPLQGKNMDMFRKDVKKLLNSIY